MSSALTLWHPEILIDVPGCPKSIISKYLLVTARDFCEKTLLWVEKHATIDVIALSGADIAFVASAPDTITSTSTDLSGFTAGQIINTSSPENPGPFTLDTVAENTLTLAAGDSLTAEDAGSTVYIGSASYALTSTAGDIVSINKVLYDHSEITPVSEFAMNTTGINWETMMGKAPYNYFMGSDRYIRLVYCPNTALSDGLEVWVCLKPLLTATTLEDFLYTDFFECLADGVRYRLLKMPKQTWTDIQLSAFYKQEYDRKMAIAGIKKHDGYVQRPLRVKMRAF